MILDNSEDILVDKQKQKESLNLPLNDQVFLITKKRTDDTLNSILLEAEENGENQFCKKEQNNNVKVFIDNNEINETILILNKDQNITGQISFLRHGESLDEKNKKDLKEDNKSPQDPKTRLSENGIKNIKVAANKIKKDILKSKKVLFYYGDKTERVKESFFIILKEIYYKNSDKYILNYSDDNLSFLIEDLKIKGIIIRVDDRFETTELIYDSKDSSQTKNIQNAESTGYNKEKQSKTALGISKISDELSQEKSTYTLIISHRTNKGGFLAPFMREKIYADFKMNDGDIINLNINKNGIIIGQYKDTLTGAYYYTNRNILYINNQNKDDLLLELERGNNNKIKAIIKRYKNKKDIFVSRDILQNYLNALFINSPQLFKDFLLSPNPDLRFFCMANLLEREGEVSLLENDGLKQIIEKSSGWEESEILDYLFGKIGKEKSVEVLEKIIPIMGDIDEKVIKKHKLKYYYNYLKHTEHQIKGIREGSVDQNIKNGKPISLSVDIEKDRYKTIEKLLNADKQILIESEAGSGKSIKLLEILEYFKKPNKEVLKGNKILFPIYVNLGKIRKLSDINYEIENQKNGLTGEDYKFIYLFDAIDEAKFNDETKVEFLNLIKVLQEKGQVIMSSRPGEIKDSEIEIEKLTLKPLSARQIEGYIKSYIYGNEVLEKKWEELKENGFIEEIKDNPLMLSMVAELLRNTDKIKNFKELGILKKDLWEILTKSELFDVIVNLRLYDWAEGKTDIVYLKDSKIISIQKTLDIRKKLLELMALESIKRRKNLSEDDIEEIIDKNDLWNGEKNIKSIMNKINLVFQYNEKDKTYKFVHEKFKEYFLYTDFKRKTLGKKMDKIEDWEDYLGKNEKGEIDFGYSYSNYDKLSYISFDGHEEIIDKYLDVFKDNYKAIAFISLVIRNIEGKKGLLLLEKIVRFKGLIDNYIAIENICLAAGKIGGDKGLELIKNIMKLDGFKENKVAIKSACLAIGNIGGEEGLKTLKSLKDISGLLADKNLIDTICLSIKKIGGEESLSMLQEIMGMSGFKDNKDAISDACRAIGKIGGKEGLRVLKELENIPGFIEDKEVISQICLAIKNMGGENCLSMLQEIMLLPGFKDNKNAISNACSAILQIGGEERLKALKKIIKYPGFQNNKNAQEYACSIAGKIGGEEGFFVLKELLETPGFQENKEAIGEAFLIIEKIGLKKGLSMLEKLFEISGFEENESAIKDACKFISEIKSEERMNILEKIIEFSGFKNNKKAITYVCWMAETTDEEKWLDIFKKIIDFSGFKENEEAINAACKFIEKTKSKEGLFILEKITDFLRIKEDKHAIDIICFTIGKIGGIEGINILKKIIKLPGFKEDKNAINKACGVLVGKGKVGLGVLEEIIEFPGFKENEKAIINACLTIKEIGGEKGMIILKKIIEASLFTENETVITYVFFAMEKIKGKKLITLFEVIVDYPWFKNNKRVIKYVCNSINEMGFEKGLDTSDEIDNIFQSKKNGDITEQIHLAIKELLKEKKKGPLLKQIKEFYSAALDKILGV